MPKKPISVRGKRITSKLLEAIAERMKAERNRRGLAKGTELLRVFPFTRLSEKHKTIRGLNLPFRLFLRKFCVENKLSGKETEALKRIVFPKQIAMQGCDEVIAVTTTCLGMLMLEKSAGRKKARRIVLDWAKNIEKIVKESKNAKKTGFLLNKAEQIYSDDKAVSKMPGKANKKIRQETARAIRARYANTYYEIAKSIGNRADIWETALSQAELNWNNYYETRSENIPTKLKERTREAVLEIQNQTSALFEELYVKNH